MERFDRAVAEQNHARAERYHNNMKSISKHYAVERGFSERIWQKYKLGVTDDIYTGRLSIPYLRGADKVVGFNFRAMNGETPKYLSPGDKHLYNTAALELADNTGEVFICEGELDAITATELYGMPAVGVPGATQWQGHKAWRELFRGYRKIWILADPDEAGMALAEHITATLPIARTVELPSDVNDCWKLQVDIKGRLK